MARVLHLSAASSDLNELLGSQLDTFADSGYDVFTASAPGVRLRNGGQNPSVESTKRHYAIPSFDANADALSGLRAANVLKSLIDEVRPNILHIHGSKPTALGQLVGRLSQVPIVVNTVHSHLAPARRISRRWRAPLSIERVTAVQSDAGFGHNLADLESLQAWGIAASKLHLLGYGIDLEEYSPNAHRARAARCFRIRLGIPFRTPTVGIVGPRVWDHGLVEVFHTVQALRKRFSRDQLAFVVTGEAPNNASSADRAAIDQMRDGYGVCFLDMDGSAKASSADLDEPSILTACDFVALPIVHDGRPRAAMRASAMGLPVVAATSPSTSSIVDHKKTGLLIRAHRPQQLALAIERLAKLPALRLALGRQARAKALEEFDERRVITRTLAVYRDLLEARGLPVPDESLGEDRPQYVDSIDLVDRDQEKSVAPRPTVSGLGVDSVGG